MSGTKKAVGMDDLSAREQARMRKRLELLEKAHRSLEDVVTALDGVRVRLAEEFPDLADEVQRLMSAWYAVDQSCRAERKALTDFMWGRR